MIILTPVVVYSKERADKLEALAAQARAEIAAGTAAVFDSVEELISEVEGHEGSRRDSVVE